MTGRRRRTGTCSAPTALFTNRLALRKQSMAGGQMAGNPWSLLAVTAVNAKDKFRKKVTDPRSLHPTSHMTPHPEFDDKAFSALEAYFKEMMPTE
jgi:hypothetical protein